MFYAVASSGAATAGVYDLPDVRRTSMNITNQTIRKKTLIRLITIQTVSIDLRNLLSDSIGFDFHISFNGIYLNKKYIMTLPK